MGIGSQKYTLLPEMLHKLIIVFCQKCPVWDSLNSTLQCEGPLYGHLVVIQAKAPEICSL